MKLKLSETTPIQINWLVATCEGWEPGKYMTSPDIRKGVNGKVIGIMVPSNRKYIWFKPSTDWAQAGPISEREGISSQKKHDGWWVACIYDNNDEPKHYALSQSRLEAEMRCYVASKLSNEVEVPDELC